MKTIIYSNEKIKLNLRQLFQYSDLMKNLAKRDVTIRYKQTWLGVLWALVRPLFNIAVFGVISILITKSTNPVDNFLYVGAGVIIWNFISSLIADCSNSLLANSNLITKVFFPKLILPLSSTIVCLIDFLIAFGFYLIAFILLKGFPGPQLFLFPLFIGLAAVLCYGAGLFFSAMNVRYRDVNFALPFLVQFLYYTSPVFLSSEFYLSHLPPVLKNIYLANPFVFIIDGFRYCLYGEWVNFSLLHAALSILFIFILLISGVRYFLKFEKTFADYI
ncbi:MAG: ABC transporter permease [Sphingobacteriaceae bacterium]|nr:ABC transporter permease [Sphingobacteriaceae bacterium]